MPIMDAATLFCESMSIAANAGASTVATNVIDTGALVDVKGSALTGKLNVSRNLCLNIVVEDEALLAAVDGSVVTFSLYGDTDAVPTTGGDVIWSESITCNTPTDHPDGTQLFCIPIPVRAIDRYLGLLIAVATQNLSAGKITAWIGPETQQ